jgi:RND superfamily putative drug exporter
MARRPWLVIVLWLALLAVAVPFAVTVTQHLASGGFNAPGSAAGIADASTSRLRQIASTPSTLIQGLPTVRLLGLAHAAHMPAAWLHVLARRAAVLIPAGPSAGPFLAAAKHDGAALTAVTNSTLGQAVSHQAIQAFSGSTVVAVPALILLLIVVFGSVLPAMLPLAAAAVGTALTMAVISVIERYIPLSVYLLQIVSFLALGTGVDYALFLSTRFRTQLESGRSVGDALTVALRTSGRSVLFSGLAVALALAALLLGGTSYWRGMALGGAVAVASVLLVTHTLLPALLRLMGNRLSLGRVRFAMPDWPLWRRLAGWATQHPRTALVVGLAVLLLPALAAPAVRANIPANVAAMLPTNSLLARAQSVEQRVNGAGSIAPFVLAVSVRTPLSTPGAWKTVAQVAAIAQSTPGVRTVESPTSHAPAQALAQGEQSRPASLAAFVAGPRLVDLFVVAAAGPDSAAAARLVSALQGRFAAVTGAHVDIGGPVAVMQSFDGYLNHRLPAMAGAVVLIAFLVLWLATGSLLQAILGVVMNGLVSLATAGILVTIIQRGGFGVTPEPLNLAVAPLVFVLLFGLSMDYEVILLHRVQERLRLGDAPHAAATHAVATTGGMITGAGLVMVAVVAALLGSPFEILQTLAIGLVSAVLLDTLVVRTFVVPAVITIAGRHAFWPLRHHEPPEIDQPQPSAP